MSWRILGEKVENALGWIVTIAAAEDIGAMIVTGIDEDFFRECLASVVLYTPPGSSNEKIICLKYRHYRR